MPQKISSIQGTLWNVLNSLNISDEICNRMLHQSWEEILGTTLAKNGELVKFSESTLEIRVIHPTWQKEFKHLEREIITKFNQQLGETMIRRIKFDFPSFGDKKGTRKKRVKS